MKSEKLDRLTLLLADTEEALITAGLRVPAMVTMSTHTLEWTKCGSDWHLVFRQLGAEEMHPILTASVRIRCEAAMKLADLRRAIDVAMLERDRQIDKAIESVEAFLASLQTSTEKEKP